MHLITGGIAVRPLEQQFNGEFHIFSCYEIFAVNERQLRIVRLRREQIFDILTEFRINAAHIIDIITLLHQSSLRQRLMYHELYRQSLKELHKHTCGTLRLMKPLTADLAKPECLDTFQIRELIRIIFIE